MAWLATSMTTRCAPFCVVFEHLLQAPAEVPGVALRGPLQQQVDGAQPDRTIARAISENGSSASRASSSRPSNARPWALYRRRGWLMLFHSAPRPSPPSRRSGPAPVPRAPGSAGSPRASPGGCRIPLAGGEDLLLLFGQEGQGIFAAPVVEQRLGLLVAQAVEAGPGRVDPGSRRTPRCVPPPSPGRRRWRSTTPGPGSRRPTAGRPGCRRGWPVRTGKRRRPGRSHPPVGCRPGYAFPSGGRRFPATGCSTSGSAP